MNIFCGYLSRVSNSATPISECFKKYTYSFQPETDKYAHLMDNHQTSSCRIWLCVPWKDFDIWIFWSMASCVFGFWKVNGGQLSNSKQPLTLIHNGWFDSSWFSHQTSLSRPFAVQTFPSHKSQALDTKYIWDFPERHWFPEKKWKKSIFSPYMV